MHKKYLEEIETAIKAQNIDKQPTGLYEPVNYIMSLGGKRMRPTLVLLGAELCGGTEAQAMPAAMAIELFHNFTLVHDDIMDKAPLRRGKATVHELWGNNTAILSGDVMVIEAYKLLCQLPNNTLLNVLPIFNTTASDVCEGQQWDMEFELRQVVSVEEYINMIRLKTAVLLGAALQIGASCANANENTAKALYDFGVNVGIAFQLQDDYLDVYGNPEKFGKQVGGDIITNKKTFLLINALEKATGEDKKALEDWINITHFDAEEKVQAVTTLYSKLGVDKLSIEKMENYANKALDILETIQGNTEVKNQLEAFVAQLMVRES